MYRSLTFFACAANAISLDIEDIKGLNSYWFQWNEDTEEINEKKENMLNKYIACKLNYRTDKFDGVDD